MDDAETYWKLLEQAASGSVRSDELMQSLQTEGAKRRTKLRLRHAVDDAPMSGATKPS
jgi:hypothetical protein